MPDQSPTRTALERASKALEPLAAVADVGSTVPDSARVDVTYTHTDGVKYGITPTTMGAVREAKALKAQIDALLAQEGEG